MLVPSYRSPRHSKNAQRRHARTHPHDVRIRMQVTQARGQEMKWGVAKKWKIGGVFFCKKRWKMGMFFCKKVDLSSTQGALCTVGLSVFFYFTFYLFWGCVLCTHPTHSPCGPAYAQTTGQPKHTMLPRSTQPCIPPGSLNRVPASAGVTAGMSPLPGGR